MAKNQNQKHRILQVYRLLYEHNKLTMDEILEHLENMEIYTERRTIYDDIKVLNSSFPDKNGDNNEFNIVIEKDNRKPVSYYLKNRELNSAELSLVKDSIKAFRYISIAQTNELLRKLDKLSIKKSTTKNSDNNLPNYAQNKDDTTFANIKDIRYAIKQDICISAENRYQSLNPHTDNSIGKRTKGQRRNWLSPFEIFFADGYYHLIAVSYSDKEEEREIVRHRIDRLKEIKLHPRTERQGHRIFDVFKKINPENSIKYLAEEKSERIKLCFEEELLDVVIERFGEGVEPTKAGRAHLETYVLEIVDEEFLGWLFSFGKRMYVSSPYGIVMDIKRYLKDMAKIYK